MHRYEMSGALTGLQRVRGMTLNDAHIFVRPDQIKEEFKRVVNLILDVYKDFGLTDYSFRLSSRDPQDKEKYYDANGEQIGIKTKQEALEIAARLNLDLVWLHQMQNHRYAESWTTASSDSSSKRKKKKHVRSNK